MQIAMLGAGAFGRALEKNLNDNSHSVRFYDPHLFPDTSLDSACENANVIIICIPAMHLDELLQNYPDQLKTLPTILATKGLHDASAFHDFTQFSAISGPAFADEILAGKNASFTASAPLALGLFKNDRIEVELSDDLTGILLCGTLKNIYAIGAGLRADSHNHQASFIQHAYNELRAYLRDHGAHPDTASLACGLGDLILSCGGDISRNFRCGQLLAKGQNLDEILAQIPTIEGLHGVKLIDIDDHYPLLKSIAVLCGREFNEGV